MLGFMPSRVPLEAPALPDLQRWSVFLASVDPGGSSNFNNCLLNIEKIGPALQPAVFFLGSNKALALSLYTYLRGSPKIPKTPSFKGLSHFG